MDQTLFVKVYLYTLQMFIKYIDLYKHIWYNECIKRERGTGQ